MDAVELHPAWHWFCPKCAHRNFTLPIVGGISDGDREEFYRKLHDMEDWQELPEDWELEVEIRQCPGTVKCSQCSTQFEVQLPGYTSLGDNDAEADES